MSKTIDGGDK